MKTMLSQKKHSKQQGYKLIILCSGGILLGSAIPILILQVNSGVSNALLLVLEALGAVVLAYVFGAFLLRK